MQKNKTFMGLLLKPHQRLGYGLVYKTPDGKDVLCSLVRDIQDIRDVHAEHIGKYTPVIHPPIKELKTWQEVDAWWESQGIDPLLAHTLHWA
jgi:hypothetical protein